MQLADPARVQRIGGIRRQRADHRSDQTDAQSIRCSAVLRIAEVHNVCMLMEESNLIVVVAAAAVALR